MPLGAGEIDYGIVGEYCAGFDGTPAVEVFSDAALLADTAERIIPSTIRTTEWLPTGCELVRNMILPHLFVFVV